MSVIIDEFEIVPASSPERGDAPGPAPQAARADTGFGPAEAARLLELRAARAARTRAH